MSQESETGDAAAKGQQRTFTMADALGQVAWLLTQSPLHRELKIKVLESIFMPPILAGQFRLFRFGELPDMPAAALERAGMSPDAFAKMPLGVAVWARLSEAAEAKVERGEPLNATDWTSGERICVIEVVAPFATAENKLVEAMVLDLAKGPFKLTPFSVFRADPKSGVGKRIVVSSHLDASS